MRNLEPPLRLAKRRPVATAAMFLAAALVAALGAYAAHVGGPPVIYRDGLWYMSMRQDAPWLPRSVRLALQTPTPRAEPGPLRWRRIAPGLDIGDEPVLVGAEEVDHLYLTRIDPALYRFELRIDPQKDLNAWMRDLHPVAVINGSYYNSAMGPATPVVIDGAARGPARYDARHGAFVSSPDRTFIADLSNGNWQSAFVGARTAFVSYPLLVAPDAGNRAPESRWLASRSFVAEDENGFIILGSAPEAFFSLHRLAEFLPRTPLRLKYVLNLDGGPVACHGVSAGGVTRVVYGHVELQSDAPNAPLRVLPASRSIHALMPIVLAAFPRDP